MSALNTARTLGATLVVTGALLAPIAAAGPASAGATGGAAPGCSTSRTVTISPAKLATTTCVRSSMDTVATTKVVLSRSSTRTVSGVKASAAVMDSRGVMVAQKSCDYTSVLNSMRVGTTRTAVCQAVLTRPQRGARYTAAAWVSGRNSAGKTVNVPVWKSPSVTSP